MSKKGDHNGRFYSWEVIVYTTPDVLQEVVLSYSEVSNYLIVYHDKDKFEDENGQIQDLKPHCHLYGSFVRRLSRVKVAKDLSFLAPFGDDNERLFTVLKENIIEIEGSLRDCAVYATHQKEISPLKFKYSVNDLISSDLKVFMRSKANVDNIAFSILQDMEVGFSLRDLAIKYGRDFVIHYRQYKDFFEDMKFEERQRLEASLSPVVDESIQIEFEIDSLKSHRKRSF